MFLPILNASYPDAPWRNVTNLRPNMPFGLS